MPKFLAVDFYCGAGGTTRGLLDAGGYVIAGIDHDAACRLTYENNNRNTALDGIEPAYLQFDMFPKSDDYQEGQQDEVWELLNALVPYYKQLAPSVPLMFAICAPCQSFTKFVQHQMTSERALGRERDQNLLHQTVKFIEKFRPEMLLSENVSGLPDGKYRQVWDDFRADLREMGYVLGQEKVCASRFGVPQFRRRSILMGLLNNKARGMTFDLTVPTHNPDFPHQVSAREAIGHLPILVAGQEDEEMPNHVCRNLAEISRHRLMSVEPGDPNFGFGQTAFGDLSLDCHRRLEEKGKRGFGDVYTRMHPDRPSPTITTRFHSISNGRFGHFDQDQVRGLSLREGAKLQSFGDSYEFYGSGMDTIARMIGNAVPPRLSAFMAKWIREQWEKEADTTIVE